MSAVEILSETELEVRDALPDDAHAISAIYAWHVLHGRASFEEVPPTVDEMRKRMKNVIDSGLPWLVALYRRRLLLCHSVSSATGLSLYAGRINLCGCQHHGPWIWLDDAERADRTLRAGPVAADDCRCG